MKKKLALPVMGLLVGAFALSGVAGAAGPPNQEITTGDVLRAAPSNLHSVYDFRTGAPGAQPERGTATESRGGAMFIVDLECGEIHSDGNKAWFAGDVVFANGGFSFLLGQQYVYYVEDNGTPGTEGPDRIGSSNPSPTNDFCDDQHDIEDAEFQAQFGSAAGITDVVDGNLSVFAND